MQPCSNYRVCGSSLFINFPNALIFLHVQEITINQGHNLCHLNFRFVWLNGNEFMSGARSLWFESYASQIRLKDANGLELLGCFFEKYCLARVQ